MEEYSLHTKLKELIDDCIDNAAEEGITIESLDVVVMIKIAIDEILEELTN